ncbi:hypothetical protein IRT45_21735 [Nocardia sp. BSTN01]|uniref:hypothetical protein n=1 Tax=Nocardia sp. BSTN01 TaxID=2783665 RepID=UPI0018905F06|nr:hypothetical protein [Nocardia sp. BSTN01]MBF4999767.1 hypothetical protein [Nocardia sp. BSTN01]
MSAVAKPYPNLGFDPVPGAPDNVAGLRGQINSAADAVKETNGLLTRLRNSNDSVWLGDGGDAFRSSFDANLAQDLGYAQNSLERAVGLLDEWHTALVGYQETAKGLEGEAATARGECAKAQTTLQQAQSNPDFGLANMQFSDQGQLAEAQRRLDAAAAQVRSASTAVDTAQGAFDAIIKRAHDLETEHNNLAKRIAAELDAAAKDFAPSPPDKSIWDKITDAVKGVCQWISDHRKQIHDILSGISAVTGLLALVTPPPADAIFGAIALVSGAGALALDFMDPEVRSAFGGVLHGDFSKDNLTKIGTSVGLDSLAVIPGAGGVLKGTGAALKGAGESGAVFKAFAEGAQSPTIMSKALKKIPRPEGMTNWLQDMSKGNGYGPGVGTPLSGIELVTRAAKAGIGGGKITTGVWELTHD